MEEAHHLLMNFVKLLPDPDRLLPGGYLYLTDILGDPTIVQKVGANYCFAYIDTPIDVVMTMATKGIPLLMQLLII